MSPQVARYRILHVDTRYPANIHHTQHARLPWTLACKLSCPQFLRLWCGWDTRYQAAATPVQELSELCSPGPGSSSHWSNLMQTRGSDYFFPIQTKLQMVGSVSPCQVSGVCCVTVTGEGYLHIYRLLKRLGSIFGYINYQELKGIYGIYNELQLYV